MADNNRNSNVNTVEEIKSRCNIVDIIGRVVSLKKAGSVYKGLCPFHNEKTPSFVVYESSQHYKCFGCNEGGDVFNFVQKYYNLDFKEAVEMLAKEYGVEVNFSAKGSKKNDEFYEINRLAARFFFREMRKGPNDGYSYMKGRGLSDETLYRFGIGYADSQWTSLTDYLTEQGYSPSKLLEVGLASEKNGRYYDKFRDRVIFPIQDTRGNVIGFGGRIIGEGEPKYLNSSESSAFQKRRNLYGLNITKDYARKEDRIILVEGYMDVISLFQAGIKNVSASLGTALTEEQARLIKRYTSNVILSYDADSAGQAAALRGVDILYREDCRARVLVVNDGKDPDEFIKAKGRKAFEELITKALPYGDYKLKRALEKYDLDDDNQKLDYLRDAIDILKSMKPVEADMYIETISKQTGISPMAIRQEYAVSEAAQSKNSFREGNRERTGDKSKVSECEMDLLKLMLIDYEYMNIPEDIKEGLFSDQVSGNIYKAIKTVDTGERPLNREKLYDLLDSDSVDMLNRIQRRVIPGDKEDVIFGDCISYIRKQKLQSEYEEIDLILRLDDGKMSSEEAGKLMRRSMEIQQILKGQGEVNG